MAIVQSLAGFYNLSSEDQQSLIRYEERLRQGGIYAEPNIREMLEQGVAQGQPGRLDRQEAARLAEDRRLAASAAGGMANYRAAQKEGISPAEMFNRLGSKKGGSEVTESQVYDKYNKGGYGTVGSAAAREAAIRDIYAYLLTTGMDATAAASSAIRRFDAVVGAGGAQDAIISGQQQGGGGGGGGVGGAAGGGVQFTGGVDPLTGGQVGVKRPIPENRSRWQDFLAENEQGRRGLFGSAIRDQNPIANPFRDYQESRFDPTEAQYNIESGLGANPPGSFSEYATGRGAEPLPQDVWKAYLQSASSLLTNPPSNMPERQGDFRTWLNDSQKNQFDLALQGYIGGVASPFRGAVRRGASDVWNNLTVNQPGQSFLPWFVGRGQRFF